MIHPSSCEGKLTLPAPLGQIWHLVLRHIAGPHLTLVYMAESGAPGLDGDCLRVDSGPRAPHALADAVAITQAAYAASIAPHGCDLVPPTGSPEDLISAIGFGDHPMLGGHHQVSRWVRHTGIDVSLHFVRRHSPFDPNELKTRMRALQVLQVSDALRGGAEGPRSAWALTLPKHADALRREAHKLMERPDTPLDVSNLRTLLSCAPPWLCEPAWSMLAWLYGQQVARHPEPRELACAVTALRLAIATFGDDAQHSEMLQRACGTLGRLLVVLPPVDRADGLDEAYRRLRALAALPNIDLSQRAIHALLGCLAARLAAAGHRLVLEDELDAATAGALLEEPVVERAVHELLETASRLAHVASATDVFPLRMGAVAAADMAHEVLERACIRSAKPIRGGLEMLAQIQDVQFRAQLHAFGLTTYEHDEILAQIEIAPTIAAAFERQELLFLRPLWSTRRFRLTNRFHWRGQLTPPAANAALTEMSLEVALRLAMGGWMETHALGGPLDLFGMSRGYALDLQEDMRESWKQVVAMQMPLASVILVLAAESEGLQWELTELVRLGLRHKVVFVHPPDSYSGPQEGLRALGYAVPDDDQARFEFISAQGEVCQRLDFDALWDGRLRMALLAAGHAQTSV